MARKRFRGDILEDLKVFPWARAKLHQAGEMQARQDSELFTKHRAGPDGQAIVVSADRWGNRLVDVSSKPKEEELPPQLFVLAVNSVNNSYAFMNPMRDNGYANAQATRVFVPSERAFQPGTLVLDWGDLRATAPPHCIPQWGSAIDGKDWNLRSTWEERGWYFKWNTLASPVLHETSVGPKKLIEYQEGSETYSTWATKGKATYEAIAEPLLQQKYGTDVVPVPEGHPFYENQHYAYPSQWLVPAHQYLAGLPPRYSIEHWDDGDTVQFDGNTLCRSMIYIRENFYCIGDWWLSFPFQFPLSGTYGMLQQVLENKLGTDPPTDQSFYHIAVENSHLSAGITQSFKYFPYLFYDDERSMPYIEPSEIDFTNERVKDIPLSYVFFGGAALGDRRLFVVPITSLLIEKLLMTVSFPDLSSEWYVYEASRHTIRVKYVAVYGGTEVQPIGDSAWDWEVVAGRVYCKKLSSTGSFIRYLSQSEIDDIAGGPYNLTYPEVENFLSASPSLPLGQSQAEETTLNYTSSYGKSIIYPGTWLAPGRNTVVYVLASITHDSSNVYYQPEAVEILSMSEKGITNRTRYDTEPSGGEYFLGDVYQTFALVKEKTYA